MFGIKNLLKISFFITFIITISACKPVLVPEEIKEAYGIFAYEINDTVTVLKNTNDTILYYLNT